MVKKCPADANVIFCAKDNSFGFSAVAIGFVRYCVRDNTIYLYEYEPASFAKEEDERDVEIYETCPRKDNFVETSYREN